MRLEIHEFIYQLDRGREIAPDEVPRLVRQVANEVGDLLRLVGAVAATAMRVRPTARPAVTPASGGVTPVAIRHTSSNSGDKIAFTVKEAAKMLGLSVSGMYQRIGRRQIGVVRLGARMIRIPKSEIGRLLSENLVPPLPRCSPPRLV
jgi:excisionase family DNA binding protein